MVKKIRRVELRYRSTKFPDVCPVCGDPVTTEGTIPAFTKAQREEGKTIKGWRFASDNIASSKRDSSMATGPSCIVIPVCDRHQFSFQETKIVRIVFSVLTGLLFVFGIYLVIVTLAGFFGLGIVNVNALSILALTIVGGACTNAIGRPSALERSISVYDMTSDMSSVILDIVSEEYAKELLSLNPMHAKAIGIGAQWNSL